MGRIWREYAVYKGDELLVIGNVKECADYMGVKPSTIYFYSNPAHRKRVKTNNTIMVERIEEDD